MAQVSVAVSDTVASALNEIVESRGLPLSPAELAEAVEINAAGERAMAGIDTPGDQRGVLPVAVPCGCLVVRTPTIAARLKLQEMQAWPRPEDDSRDTLVEYVTVLTAWILDAGRDIDELALLQKNTAQAIYADTRRRMTATQAELNEAVGAVVRGLYPVVDVLYHEDAELQQDAGIDWAMVLLALANEGGSPEEWLTAYEPHAWHTMGAMRRRNDARKRARDEAAGNAAAPGPHDPRVRASAAWHAFAERLQARRK